MGQWRGWSFGLVFVALACDAPPPTSKAPTDAADAGGNPSSCSSCDAGNDAEPTIDLDAGQGATGGVTGDSGACTEEAGAAPELRPGCPDAEPVASGCDSEGLRCLYTASDPSCRNEWQCVYGIWSPRPTPCTTEAAATTNEALCPALEPIDGEPCSKGELECDYGACSLGPAPDRATCTCGRWSLRDNGCIEVP